MAAPREIEELVGRFERRIDELKSADFNELELRDQFLNPFFSALGWDVHNRQDLPADQREVKLEEAIRVEESIKNPDYTFRLSKARKFFVEAKKPAVNIEGGVYPAFQVRRYAWSAGLPVSILTDFEEFSVYDCRSEPHKTDKPVKARLLYLQYDQYVERWDEIASLFSREAVLAGSLDRYIESMPERRGTKRVDAALLDEISGWREALARNMSLRNASLPQPELNFAVQRTIDRILFLRICEDRSIEEYGRLRALLEGEGVYQRLQQLFVEADERYNSGIFRFRDERGQTEPPDRITPALAVDDAVLKDIIKDLYFPDSPYVFSEIPAEILGQVYEQFLGKVIVLEELNGGHSAKVEYKPEVRKAGGVYYTPSYIVEYIVKNTVGKLLEGKTPLEAADLRILDPACGSGSFLIGAYQYLLDWHQEWYLQNLVPLRKKRYAASSPEVLKLLPQAPERREDRRARKIHARAAEAALPVFQAGEDEWRLTTAERKRILLNSIYGVDIDPQAVEVTKLSLLLKVLEGETEETISSLLRYARERALPDLWGNIKCGNSLIGWDILDDRPDLSKEELQRINPFDWKGEFSEVFEQGGFDAVIGNPPYIQLSMADYYDKATNNYFSQKYSSSMGRLNTFGLFIERGLNLLAAYGALLSFIVPNTLLTQEYYQDLRLKILDYQLDSLTAYRYPVFKDAVVETIVFLVSKININNKNKIKITIFDNKLMSSEFREIDQDLYHETNNNSFLINVDRTTIDLKNKLDRKGTKLGDLTHINQAIALKHDRAKSLFKEQKGDNFKPVLDGRNIQRYRLDWAGYYLAYDIKCIHSCKRTDIFEADEKLFFRRVGDRLIATFDDRKFYALNTLVVITSCSDFHASLKYLLGLINSRLLNYYYLSFLKSTKKVFSEIQARQLAQLPIRIIDFSNPEDVARHGRIVSLVQTMLDLHKQLVEARGEHERTVLQRRIEATDTQIDALVYELYELTEEEIKIVDGT